MLYLIHKIALCDNKSLKCAERGFIYHKTYERPTWRSRYYQAFKGKSQDALFELVTIPIPTLKLWIVLINTVHFIH